MKTGFKRPIIVTVAVPEELMPKIENFRIIRHLRQAKRVEPKLGNLGPVSSQQILQEIKKRHDHASAHLRSAKKHIVLVDTDKVAMEVTSELQKYFIHGEEFEVWIVGDFPGRIGFFIPRKGEE